MAVVLLWLTLLSAVWLFMEPSVHGGEHLHDARARMARAVVRDPVFWATLAVALLTGFVAFNSGISMSYDAAEGVWRIGESKIAAFPGSADGCGVLPFALAVFMVVILQGIRHALGRSARAAFLLVSSVLAGWAGILAAVLMKQHVGLMSQVVTHSSLAYSFVGAAFGLYALSGIVALSESLQRKWKGALPFFVFAVGGTSIGCFLFSPALLSLSFAIGGIALIAYSFMFLARKVRESCEFKFLAIAGASLAVGGLLVVTVLSDASLEEKTSPFVNRAFLTDDFMKARETLSQVAVKVWKARPWAGEGIGTFPIGLRFSATEDDWQLVPNGVQNVPNAGLSVLAERGIVGAVALVLPLAILFGLCCFYAFEWVRLRKGLPMPACFLGFLALLICGVTGFFDCSFLRADAFAALGGFLALSANSLQWGGKTRSEG